MAIQSGTQAAPATLHTTQDVTASLVYVKRDPRHKNEKPYRLHYNPPPGLERQNFTLETCGPTVIRDLRDRRDISFDETGFAVLDMAESQMAKQDFYDEDKVKRIYYQELKEVLTKRFAEIGPVRVEVLEHLVRKRHPGFPVSTGADYAHEQPTSIAHVDYTLSSAKKASRELVGIDPEDYERIIAINAWKPLEGPLTDWPLAVCDARTVERVDCEASDIVRRDGFTENYLVYYNQKQEWWYLSGQRVDEIMLFRQADIRGEGEGNLGKGVPHTGFNNMLRNENEVPRESIEARVFIYF